MRVKALAESDVFRSAGPHEKAHVGLATEWVSGKWPYQLNAYSLCILFLQQKNTQVVAFVASNSDLLACRQHKCEYGQADEEKPDEDKKKTTDKSRPCVHCSVKMPGTFAQ